MPLDSNDIFLSTKTCSPIRRNARRLRRYQATFAVSARKPPGKPQRSRSDGDCKADGRDNRSGACACFSVPSILCCRIWACKA